MSRDFADLLAFHSPAGRLAKSSRRCSGGWRRLRPEVFPGFLSAARQPLPTVLTRLLPTATSSSTNQDADEPRPRVHAEPPLPERHKRAGSTINLPIVLTYLPPWKATPTHAPWITAPNGAENVRNPATFTPHLAQLRVHFNERLV